MMRILMTAARCSPKMGGVERHVEALRTELETMGHDVFVAELGEGIRSLRALPRLALRLFRQKYDVVHAHDFLPAIATWLALRLTGNRTGLHVTIHGYEGYPLRARFIAGHRLAHRLAKNVVAVGAYIDRWYGTRSSVVTHGGVRHAPQSAVPHSPRVVFVSRLAPDTSCMQIADGFIRAGGRFSGTRFAIYGFGPLAESLAALCSGTAVEFGGPVSDAESVVSAATVVVANSYLAILEAFSAGKAVISYYDNALKRDYLAEIAAASSGILLAGNARDLDAAIARLLNDADVRERLAANGAAYAKRFLWRNVASDYLNLWCRA